MTSASTCKCAFSLITSCLFSSQVPLPSDLEVWGAGLKFVEVHQAFFKQDWLHQIWLVDLNRFTTKPLSRLFVNVMKYVDRERADDYTPAWKIAKSNITPMLIEKQWMNLMWWWKLRRGATILEKEQMEERLQVPSPQPSMFVEGFSQEFTHDHLPRFFHRSIYVGKICGDVRLYSPTQLTLCNVNSCLIARWCVHSDCVASWS